MTNANFVGRASTDPMIRATQLDLRLFLDSIPGLVATNTPTGETELVNQQLLDYFGRTLEEIKGWRTLDAVHPDDLHRVVATIDRWMQSPDGPRAVRKLEPCGYAASR